MEVENINVHHFRSVKSKTLQAHMYHESNEILIAYTKRDSVKVKLIIEGLFYKHFL